MAKTSKNDELRPIIVKKVKKGGGGHHGGAWKVAYADFVTAMMAFFLLLWLLNVSTDDALETISNYFDPSNPKIADTTSGAGGVMGGTSVSVDGAMTTTVQNLTQSSPTGKVGEAQSTTQQENQTDLEKLEEQLRGQEDQSFEEAKKEMEEAIKNNAELAELAKNMIIDITPEGLRIQLIDQEGKPLFPIGSAQMYDYTRKLIEVVSTSIKKMPQKISIRGHSDSHKYPPGAKYTNWELSSDRANSSRRELLDDGIPVERVADVMGKADTDHLIKENPLDPRNRRITMILLRESVKQAFDRGAFGSMKSLPAPQPRDIQKPAFQKTPGSVYFP